MFMHKIMEEDKYFYFLNVVEMNLLIVWFGCYSFHF